MSLSKSYKPAHTWYLLAILAFLLFARLGAAPIYILDEAKNAQCAREMLQRGDWVVPTFNGELRTDKPVLHYYFMMAAYKLFGINEFAARFFSAVFGWLSVLLTFLFTKRYINELAAFCSALVLVASTHFLFEFRLSVPDPYLIFFITAGLFSACHYLHENSPKYLLIAAACFGLATLAKGPVALALPGLCLLIWITWTKKWRQVLTFWLIPALMLLCGITLPWYIAVHKATNGAWTRGFFIQHNLNRFSDPQEGHGGFFLITLLFVLVGLLPFSANVVELVKQRRPVFQFSVLKFCLIVVAAFVVFFSVSSTRLPNYAMPCYPFAAIMLGYLLSQQVEGTFALKKYVYAVAAGVLLLVPVAAFFALRQEKEAAAVGWTPLLLLAGFVALLAVLLKWQQNNNYQKVVYVVCAYSLFNLLLLHTVYPVVYRQNPVAKTLPEVLKHDRVFAYEIYNPGYNFYLKQKIQRFYSLESLRKNLAEHPNAVVITRTTFADSLQPLGLKEKARHHDLFEIPTTVLYVNGEEK